MKVRKAEPLRKRSRQRHKVFSEHLSVTFVHIWHKYVLSFFCIVGRSSALSLSTLNWCYCLDAQDIRGFFFLSFFSFLVIYASAEATECRGFVFTSLCCWLSACLSIYGRIHWAYCSKLRRLDWHRYLCVHNSCSSNNNTLSASLNSLLMWKGEE